MKWKLIQIIAVYPGPDNHVRVVTERIPFSSEFKRPAFKLSVASSQTKNFNS